MSNVNVPSPANVATADCKPDRVQSPVRMTLALSAAQMNVLLACVLLLGVAIMAFEPTLRVSPNREEAVGAGVGLFSGLLGGVSSLTGPLVITYLLSLKIDMNGDLASFGKLDGVAHKVQQDLAKPTNIAD